MRIQRWKSSVKAAAWSLAAAVAAGTVLVACGGGGGGNSDGTAPTAALSQTGAVLPKNTPIVVRFSEPMNPASLQLGGTLASEAIGTWSKTHGDNDTYTLSPPATGWTLGDRNLTIQAADLAGNALENVNANYAVKLVFDNFQPAEVVIGQADFMGTGYNQDGLPAANTLGFPFGNPAVPPDGKLFIGDYANNRVLAFNAVPTANNANADFVLGQPDFTSDDFTVEHGSHPAAQQIAIGKGKMAVTDFGGNRVVIYDGIPANGSAVQSVVVGQPDFTSLANDCSRVSFDGPEAATLTPDGKLVVADTWNHRVLIWNSIPTTNGQAADVVLGQGGFERCAANDNGYDGVEDDHPTSRTLYYPSGIWSDGRRLVVSDYANHRVLIWNTFPTGNFQPADVVLGQATFTGGSDNDDDQNGSPGVRPTARTLAEPYIGVASNGIQLAITDSGNNRVLIWNTFPTDNFQPADVVLGQGAFDFRTANDDDQNRLEDDVASARVLHEPRGLLFHEDKLFVVDGKNSRVLVFRSR